MTTKKTLNRLAQLLALAFLPALDAASLPSPEMVGQWEGNAQIIVIWCRQQQLKVSVEIFPDGRVSGRIGDAEISDGKISRNRGPLGRKLQLATDWIIRGNLVGAVVAAEGIQRTSFSMPLNFSHGQYEGCVHTSGRKFGGKDSMILTASSLTLARVGGALGE